MPEYYETFDIGGSINDINAYITQIEYRNISRWDPYPQTNITLFVNTWEEMNKIITSIHDNGTLMLRQAENTITGVCTMFSCHHEEPGVYELRLTMSAETINTLDTQYPHTCKKCDKKLKFRELEEANRDISEEDLKAMWISNEIKFYCCTCYRSETGNCTDWQGLDNMYTADYRDRVLWMGTNPVSDGFTGPIENCGSCTYGERIGRVRGRNFRCSLEPTQIHQREYRCDGYHDTYIIDTTEPAWVINDTLDAMQSVMDQCDVGCTSEVRAWYDPTPWRICICGENVLSTTDKYCYDCKYKILRRIKYKIKRLFKK